MVANINNHRLMSPIKYNHENEKANTNTQTTKLKAMYKRFVKKMEPNMCFSSFNLSEDTYS